MMYGSNGCWIDGCVGEGLSSGVSFLEQDMKRIGMAIVVNDDSIE